MRHFVPLFFTCAALSACSVGNGGTVLPSPIGDLAVSKACREAPSDVLPNPALTADHVRLSEGVGSAAEVLEPLRMGFKQVSFMITPKMISDAEKLAPSDPNRWSQAPLTDRTGIMTFEVAAKGDPRCGEFEREVQAQRNSSDPKAASDDPMKYWTDTRFPAAPAEGRNWCIASFSTDDEAQYVISRDVETSREGQSTVTIVTDLVESNNDTVVNPVARRTLVRMYRTSFPIGVNQVGTGCDGRTFGSTPEFWGPTGIALKPAAAPTLVNR